MNSEKKQTCCVEIITKNFTAASWEVTTTGEQTNYSNDKSKQSSTRQGKTSPQSLTAFPRSWRCCWSCAGDLITKFCLTLVTPCTVAHQALLSTGFPRQEYWSELPCPSPGDLADPGVESASPALQVDSTGWATRNAWQLLKSQVTLLFWQWWSDVLGDSLL